MGHVITFIVGMMCGGVLGVIVMALIIAGDDSRYR